MKDQSANPSGKHGKPITLGDMTFDEAVRKMLSTQPPKSEKKTAKGRKKPANRKVV